MTDEFDPFTRREPLPSKVICISTPTGRTSALMDRLLRSEDQGGLRVRQGAAVGKSEPAREERNPCQSCGLRERHPECRPGHCPNARHRHGY